MLEGPSRSARHDVVWREPGCKQRERGAEGEVERRFRSDNYALCHRGSRVLQKFVGFGFMVW